MSTDKTENIKRESFIFYLSFKQAIDECPNTVRLEIYEAIANYAFERLEPNFTDAYARICWRLIKPQLDANWERYKNGLQGGAPKGNKNARKTT